MTTPTQQSIKAILNYGSFKPDALVSAAKAIGPANTNNPNFAGAAPPPFDPATFVPAADTLSASIAAALDGGTKAVAQMKNEVKTVVNMLVQYGHYVEANCKGDMTIFLSTGYKARASKRTMAAPANDSIRKAGHGPNTGQFVITLIRVLDALSHEVRTAPIAGGVPGTWTTQPVTGIRKPTIVSGLTPGTVYAIQARALLKTGFTDWSDSVTLMCM